MGYCTCFTLEVRTADNSAVHPNCIEIIASLRKENESALYGLDEEGSTQPDAKWYDSDLELKEFSKKFPDALFILEGDGEGSDDFWRAYFKNGLGQMAPVLFVYDEYDETKLA